MKSIVVGGLTRGPVSVARGLVAASALLLSGSVYAAGVTIDDFIDIFTDGDIDASNVVVANGEGSTACGQATQRDGLILGGERDVYIEVTEGSRGVTAEADGILAISSELQTSGSVIVQWDGRDNGCSLAHNLDVDLTATGNNQFAVTVVESDKDATVVFRAYSASERWSEYSLFVADGTRNRTFTFGFSEFRAMGANGAVRWESVSAITMRIMNAPTNFEIGFDMIVTDVEYKGCAVEGGQICWETVSENKTDGFDAGRCSSAGCEVFGSVAAEGSGSSYCVAIPGGNVEEGYVYGVVEVDRNGNWGDVCAVR